MKHPSQPSSRLKRLKMALAALMMGAGLTLVHAEPVDGEVRKIDTTAGKITLRHEEIKSLNMPPMTMAYRVRNPEWLSSVQVGDRVRFSAEKVNGQFTITELAVSR